MQDILILLGSAIAGGATRYLRFAADAKITLATERYNEVRINCNYQLLPLYIAIAVGVSIPLIILLSSFDLDITTTAIVAYLGGLIGEPPTKKVGSFLKSLFGLDNP